MRFSTSVGSNYDTKIYQHGRNVNKMSVIGIGNSAKIQDRSTYIFEYLYTVPNGVTSIEYAQEYRFFAATAAMAQGLCILAMLFDRWSSMVTSQRIKRRSAQPPVVVFFLAQQRRPVLYPLKAINKRLSPMLILARYNDRRI